MVTIAFSRMSTVAFRFPSMLSMRSSKVIFTRSDGSANRRDWKVSLSVSLVGAVPCPISRIPCPSHMFEVIKPPPNARVGPRKTNVASERRHTFTTVSTAEPMMRGLESN